MDEKGEVEWRERVRRLFEAMGEAVGAQPEDRPMVGREAVRAAWLKAKEGR